MFTWKKNEGLSLYVNGHLKDHMKHLIDKPGLHHTDKLTRFEIARNIAGPPYGHAQFTINSLAFFDEHLSKADALREYIYYWGNGKLLVMIVHMRVVFQGLLQMTSFLFCILSNADSAKCNTMLVLWCCQIVSECFHHFRHTILAKTIHYIFTCRWSLALSKNYIPFLPKCSLKQC